jgi:tetratricopeptide (TPR) repeat protein
MAFSFCILIFALLSGCVSGTPEQRLAAGAAAFQRGDTAAAVKEFQNALRLDRNFAAAHYNLGISYSTVKTRDRAVAEFGKAIECDPRYAEAYIALAQAYIRKDTLDAAIGVLQRGLGLGVTPAAFHENLGYCYMRQSNKDSAIAAYQRAIALDPANPNNYFNIGYLLNQPFQSDSSIHYLRLAYKYAANKSAISYLLGTRLLDKPRRSAAETKEGISMLEDYLANGDQESMKVSKAREMIAGVQPKK